MSESPSRAVTEQTAQRIAEALERIATVMESGAEEYSPRGGLEPPRRVLPKDRELRAQQRRS